MEGREKALETEDLSNRITDEGDKDREPLHERLVTIPAPRGSPPPPPPKGPTHDQQEHVPKEQEILAGEQGEKGKREKGSVRRSQKRWFHIIYTGGTFGCVAKRRGASPESAADVKAKILQCQRFESLKEKISFDSIEPPIDSSKATLEEWKRVATCVSNFFNTTAKENPSVIIIHGTDTLAYCTSYLHFALPELKQSVIVTGAQQPAMNNWDSDGWRNLSDAFNVASKLLNGVFVVFGGRVIPGDRAVKVDSKSLTAFDSPNYECISVEDEKQLNKLRDSASRERSQVDFGHVEQLEHDSRVKLLFLFPGITPDDVKAIVGDARGLIVRAYGTGNGPDAIVDCLSALAASQKLAVGVSTTCMSGGTSEGAYSSALKGPVVYLGNMTTEAAFCKLSILLHKHGDDIVRTREDLSDNRATKKKKKNVESKLLATRKASSNVADADEDDEDDEVLEGNGNIEHTKGRGEKRSREENE